MDLRWSVCIRETRLSTVFYGVETVSGDCKYLTQREVASRLRVNERTLEGWRWRQIGPRFHRFGGSSHGAIRYALADIEAYETATRC